MPERAFDWSHTPIGSPDTWPENLRIALEDHAGRQRESERREKTAYRCLLEAFEEAPVAIAVLHGPEHTFEFVNQSYAALVGGRPLLNLPIRKAQPELERSENESVLRVLDRAYSSGRTAVSHNLRVWLKRDANGAVDERVFHAVCQPLRTENGTVHAVVVIAVEVTELEIARRDAETASRAKDEFLAMVGHELRNPLAPILTALHLIRLKGFNGAERERATIERQVRHLTSLVDDLLDVSRITGGKVQLHKRRIHLADAVARAIELTSPLLEERQHQLHIDVPRVPDLEIDADFERLSQVIANLLTNAAKYTEPGGRIWVTGATDPRTVILRVRDSGIGISRHLLAQVFESFSQERQSLDRANGGLGLGLAIVKSLVELHGGRVVARSEGPRTGAEFEIRLPQPPVAQRSSGNGEQNAAEPSTAAQNGRRILVVDDNEDAAQMLAESLHQHGHQTRVALDASSALRMARDFKPEVALLDIGLPGMDGYELAIRLRQIPGLDDLRLMAVTGYGQESDRQRSAAAGFDSHLVKPIELAQLDALVAATHRQ